MSGYIKHTYIAQNEKSLVLYL